MAKLIDLNSPLSQEDVDYLVSRGRRHQLPANFRRFGEPGNYHDPVEGEEAGSPVTSPFYDQDARAQAVYDQGGAPLPNTTLDYNTGRVFDRENGVTLVAQPAGHTPGAFGSRYDQLEVGRDEDDGDIDEDIAQYVTSLTIPVLEKTLKDNQLGLPAHESVESYGTVEELLDKLVELEVQTEKTDKKADLQKRLKAAFSKQRKETMQDILAVFLQDARRGGEQFSFAAEDEPANDESTGDQTA